MTEFFKKMLQKGIFRWILVFEIIFVILFGAFLITRPENSFKYSAKDLVDESNLVDGAIELSRDNPQIPDTHFYIHLGGYETTVNYEIISDEDGDDGADGDVENIGLLHFVSARQQVEIPDSSLRLTDITTSETGRLYSDFGQPVVMWLSYSGEGKMRVYSIEIKEVVWFKIVLFLISIFGFIVIDLIYFFIKTKKISLKTKKTIAILVGISLVASITFFANTIPFGHDLDFHLTRIAAVSDELEKGNFPVRMMTEMLNGYSYPNSIFYCDIFLYIPALLYMMFVPLRICYQVYCIIFTLATCFITYFCLRKITKNNKASLIGSLIYTLSMYRLSNVLVRGAVGEFSAMTFLPLIILGLYQIYTTERPKFRDYAPLGIGVALVSMCHIISTELSLFFILVFCLIKFKKTFKKTRFFSLIKAALLCLGLSAWFLIPLIDYTINQPVNVTMKGTTGFYTDMVSYPAEQFNPLVDSKTFISVGIVISFGMILAIWFLIVNRNNEKINRNDYGTMLYLIIIGGLAFIASSYFFPWRQILELVPDKIASIITSVQFPFRFLSIVTVCFSFSIAILLANIKNTTKISVYEKPITLGFVIITILSALYLSHSCLIDIKQIAAPYATKKDLAYVSGGEYLPVYNDSGKTADMIKNIEVQTDEDIDVSYERVGNEYHFDYDNNNDKEVKAILPIYAYRYFKATDEVGNEIETAHSEDQLIQIDLPAKTNGRIIVKFEPPVFWHIAEVVSLLTILVCTGWCLEKEIDNKK